ncbi:hypothetical protein C0992_006355 [Termitomyces sp. T32_za158]|nr:hypothetical protein C0992_006355 [Termitomyces sp. T32_za158]
MNTVESTRRFFTFYDSATEIDFSPEEALKEGSGMVSSIKSSLEHLQFGNKLRQEVWMRELESNRSREIFDSERYPGRYLEVFNVDDALTIRASCTAVVTEVSYHKKPTIDADVSFLSEADWKEELAVLLTDLVGDDGNLKRSTDLKRDAGIAWSKVHAVYPNISEEQLLNMSADNIIALDQTIAETLGTTKNIIAADSKSFAKKIGKYINSNDEKRGDKRKDKAKLKGHWQALDNVNEGSGTSGSKDQTADADVPALWPLIRQVSVRCNAAALSTGAVLVDLPGTSDSYPDGHRLYYPNQGVADANVARNNIAKDYMKKCDCIWILAPITRAVDDKTARGMCE